MIAEKDTSGSMSSKLTSLIPKTWAFWNLYSVPDPQPPVITTYGSTNRVFKITFTNKREAELATNGIRSRIADFRKSMNEFMFLFRMDPSYGFCCCFCGDPSALEYW